MKTSIYFFAAIVLLFLTSCDKETKNNETPFSENSEATQLAKGFSFTEGPTADKEGNIYFTDQPNNLIYKYTTEGQLDTFSTESGRSNGLYIDTENNLWACADMYHQLWKFQLNGEKEVILNPDSSNAFNGPNDVWVHKNGNVYFTDPHYKRPYWEGEHDTLEYKGLYVLFKGQNLPIMIDSSLVQPNGIIGASDKNLLFVADIGDDKIFKYRILPDGTLAEKELFVEKGSDGMALDNHLNLYITGNGVDVYDSTGTAIRHIEIPEDWTANITFGGKQNDELYITASTGLYGLKTSVKGVN
ncbi:gluconolactonase [Marivirga lumbricoides]|uniref:Gluconolactonase n=1 Tax=Marivirga lumbricoides TaxID=1046115 RepID=A0ABQ1MEM7_9BACT|nr:gluconolactonase [Marivirga lumbricoides]